MIFFFFFNVFIFYHEFFHQYFLCTDNKDKILNKLTGVDSKIMNVQTEVSEIHTFAKDARALKDNVNVRSLRDFCNTHNIELPIESIEDFEVFDRKIVNEVFDDLVRSEDYYVHSCSCFYDIIFS